MKFPTVFPKRWRRGGMAGLAVAVAAGATASANDNFADAIALTGELPLSGEQVSNAEATAESNEPDHVFESIATRSLWWKWTPATETAVEVSTGSSDFDTVLAIYRGPNVQSLTKIASNDDLSDFALQSRVRFIAEAGVTYHIAVDGFASPTSSASGVARLSLLGFTSGPANDHWANAIVLSGLPPVDSVSTNRNGTVEDGEPFHLTESDHAATSWWKWTAPATMSVSFSSLDFAIDDSMLAVYRGPASQAGADFSSLKRIGSNDDNDAGDGSTVSFKATSGTTYYFAVDGVSNTEGDLSVRLRAGPAAPPNDSFATPIAVGSGFTSGRNTGATAQAGEPDHLGSPPGTGPTSTVWWSYTPLANSPVEINTFNSLFDTALAVYTGNALGSLTLVERNDNAGGLQSRVRFNVFAGQTYRIAVDGTNGSEGRVTLRIIEPGPARPDNDDFLSAHDLGNGTGTSASGSNLGATTEFGEPPPTSDASAWWKWSAPATARVEVNTFGSNYDSTLGIYRGSEVTSLVSLGFNDNTGSGQSRVIFPAVVGETYYFAVGGNRGAEGNVTLNLQMRGSLVVWLENFPSLTGPDRNPHADKDGDGFTNLQEMAFGLSPLLFSRPGGPDPNASRAPAYTLGPTEMKIEYEIDPLYIDVSHNGGPPVRVEGQTGASVSSLASVIPTFIGGNRYRVAVPVTSDAARFLRVTVVNPN